MVYVLFCLTTLCYIGLAILTGSKPSFGGESGGMGYGLALAFWGLGLGVSSLVLTITLLAKGNFLWVAGSLEARTGLTLMAWLCMVLPAFFCAAAAIFTRMWFGSNRRWIPPRPNASKAFASR
jgi:hypothetical protein